MADSALPFKSGDWAKPRSPGGGAGSVPWQRRLVGALLGPARAWRAAGTLVTRSCEWFAPSQRPGRDVFFLPFSFGRLFGAGWWWWWLTEKEREGGGGEIIPIPNPPTSHPSTISTGSSLHHRSPGPVQSPPPRSFSSSLDLIVSFPHNTPRTPRNT